MTTYSQLLKRLSECSEKNDLNAIEQIIYEIYLLKDNQYEHEEIMKCLTQNQKIKSVLKRQMQTLHKAETLISKRNMLGI